MLSGYAIANPTYGFFFKTVNLAGRALQTRPQRFLLLTQAHWVSGNVSDGVVNPVAPRQLKR
jgi:hypothetical protein